MARSTETEPRRRRGGIANLFVWVLLGLLIVGLAGFSVTNFGGGLTAIGRVGDRDITVNDYASALRSEINAFSAQVGQNVTLAQAQALGLDRQVLQRLVATAALDNEAARIGISAGDARVATEVRGIAAFQGPAGAFDREAYRFTLERNNLNEAQFETRLREDLGRSILQGAVAAGFSAPPVLADTLFAFVAERRAFSLLRLTEDDLAAPLPEPDEAALRAYHEANIARFTAPEARRITWVALLPADLAPTIEVDEALLRRLYEQRIEDFVQPERRLVERLVFATENDALAARARLDAGEDFETLVAERGLTLVDIDMGDVSEADLGIAGITVFGLEEPGIVGPLPSPIGPALYRMNAVLMAQEVTFDEARDELSGELAADAARRAIADRRDTLDDLLAGGATLEELATDEGMTIGTLDLTPDTDAPIAGYAAFRQAALDAREGDFADLIQLEDGGLAALRLEAIVPPAPIPFEQAREAVAEAARADALAGALSDRAVEVKAALDDGASLGAFGIVEVIGRIVREGFVEGVPPTLVPAVFDLAEGDVRVIEGPGFVGLIRLDRIEKADPADPGLAPLRAALVAQGEQALAQDAFSLFTTALTSSAGITLNEAAIAAVHAQFQ